MRSAIAFREQILSTGARPASGTGHLQRQVRRGHAKRMPVCSIAARIITTRGVPVRSARYRYDR